MYGILMVMGLFFFVPKMDCYVDVYGGAFEVLATLKNQQIKYSVNGKKQFHARVLKNSNEALVVLSVFAEQCRRSLAVRKQYRDLIQEFSSHYGELVSCLEMDLFAVCQGQHENYDLVMKFLRTSGTQTLGLPVFVVIKKGKVCAFIADEQDPLDKVRKAVALHQV